MNVIDRWPAVRAVFTQAFRSSLHFAVASVGPDGAPHVTPIGSVLLSTPGRGIYFEVFTRGLPHNVQRDARVCVLAVDSGRWRWLRAFTTGRFSTPPALRLHGRIVGESRPPTAEELAQWQRRVGPLRHLRGYSLLWGHLESVRDIQFDRADPIALGVMTAGLW